MAGPFDRLKSALSGRYRIERTLGSGGMATVYLAHDLKHDRQVAVKVLRPDLAATIGVGRFLREIEIAARLTHPHIVDLHDSGEVDGTLYYVMPYLSGGSLRAWLEREGTLERSAVLSITQEVAEALDHAHGHGVIHRDVKPENILISGGHALVADFGIAKALASGGTALTRTGFAVGTPGYMSPEQAAGLTDLDGRADVYSLGCVVYEMLVGATPGLWPTDEASRLGRFVDASAQHRAVLDGLPGRWEQALVKALAMRREDRFASAIQLARALEAASGTRDRYDAARIREIVGRAAETQAQFPTPAGGLSVAVMEQAASEAGIPSERVRQAIEELEGGGRRDTEGTPFESGGHEGYSDEEFRAIIARAVELEERALTTSDGALSIGGVERVAAEVGITPDRVRAAIQELERQEMSGPWLYGHPAVLVADRSVDGEAGQEQWAAMLHEIRAALATDGSAGKLEESFVWSDAADTTSPGNVLITITPSRERTLIRLRRTAVDLSGKLSGAATGWIGGVVAAIGVAAAVGADAASAAPLLGIGLGAVGAYVGSRWSFVQELRQRQQKLEELADRLAGVMRSGKQ